MVWRPLQFYDHRHFSMAYRQVGQNTGPIDVIGELEIAGLTILVCYLI
jgi:hypothetical protein